jgi:phosphoribosylformylglycinamidine (FGAM) synthase PurS component
MTNNKLFQIELVVNLKIPDTTTITAFRTLKEMGFNELTNMKRKDYYRFTVRAKNNTELDEFAKKITKVDVLVNNNKHEARVSLISNKLSLNKEYINNKNIIILIKDIDDENFGLFSTLKNRLGFRNIEKIEKGVLWELGIDEKDKNKRLEIVRRIINNLLMNKHYQEYIVLKS